MMGRHYSFKDVNSDEKPRIAPGVHRFGTVVYTWVCAGRSSTGYGTTPAHAFERWERNWKRRYAFYKRRSDYTREVLRGMH